MFRVGLLALRIICLVLLFGLTACRTCSQVAPLEVPESALYEAVDSASRSPEIFDTATDLPEAWWELFNDPQLTLCVEQALECHPSLQMACLQVSAARHRADLVRARMNPLIALNGSITPQHLSETSLIPFGPGFVNPDDIPLTFTLYDLHFSLIYDFDLWGKTRAQLCAAWGEHWARAADAAVVELNLSLAVADAYFKLQTAYRRLDCAKGTVSCSEAIVDLTQKRVDRGLDSCFALSTAKSQLSLAKQQLWQCERDLAAAKTQLRVYLADNFCEDFLPSDTWADDPPRIPVPHTLPLHLIARRPDIIAQLWLIQSANHQLFSARARFYPDVNVVALLGYQTIHFHEWFSNDSVYNSVSPAFSLPLFDWRGGIANLKGCQVDYDLAVARYNELILNAVKEVVDGVTTVQTLHKQLKASAEQVQDKEGLQLCMQARLEANLASKLDALRSEQAKWVECDREATVRGGMFQATLGLIKALGGGYDACEEDS